MGPEAPDYSGDPLAYLRAYVECLLREGKANRPRKGMKSRWSLKYKRSIDCSHPRGFSQTNYCKRRARGGHYSDG